MQPEGIDNFQADLPYSGFPSELGNHRVVIQVDYYQPVVRVNLPWRCPRGVRGVTVVDAATGQVVNNVIVIALSRDQGNIAFEPITGLEDYYVYYLAPYPTVSKVNQQWVDHINSPHYRAKTGNVCHR